MSAAELAINALLFARLCKDLSCSSALLKKELDPERIYTIRIIKRKAVSIDLNEKMSWAFQVLL